VGETGFQSGGVNVPQAVNPLFNHMRRAGLFQRLIESKVPRDEVWEAMGVVCANGTSALEQLAAQYGLLIPGTQGAT
jgi:hypothetical protein